MTVPAYTTDLTTLDACDTDTGYVEPTASGWTQLNAETFSETDLFIQGLTCISATVKTGVGATLFNNTTGVTIPTDGAFLVWAYWSAPNSLATSASGGIRTIIGSGTAAFKAWKQGGNDTYTLGGWVNLATNPTVSADYTEGSPTATLQYFGWAYNAPTSVPGKGNPYCVDVLRYGRCEARFAYGEAADYCTFAGFAAINDANDVTDGYNRWGLITAVPGGFKWKGLMTLGYTNAVDFRDSNTLILIEDTPKCTSGFNKIEIRVAGSRVDWTSISFQSLGTTSPGSFEVIDNADVNIESCSFTDMDAFIFLANSTTNDSIFRRCGTISQGNSVFSGCLFDAPSVATTVPFMTCDNIANVSDCTFVSGGAGHAIELDSTHAASPTTHSFTNISSSGYSGTPGTNLVAASGNNDATIFNNSGKHLILNVSGGTTPSIRNGAGATTTIQSSVDVTITVVDQNNDPINLCQISVHLTSDDSEVLNEDSNASGVATTSYGGSTPAACYIRARKSSTGTARYINASSTGTIESSTGLNTTIVMRLDPIVED